MPRAEETDRVSLRRNGVIVSGKRPPALTGAQARVARGLLGWSQARLAQAAKVGLAVVRDVEADRFVRAATLTRVRDAFTQAKVVLPVEGEPSLRA